MALMGREEGAQEPDATMRLKVANAFKADETMQLRVPLPDISNTGEYAVSEISGHSGETSSGRIRADNAAGRPRRRPRQIGRAHV